MHKTLSEKVSNILLSIMVLHYWDKNHESNLNFSKLFFFCIEMKVLQKNIFLQGLFLAALSSSRSLVVRRSVRL